MLPVLLITLGAGWLLTAMGVAPEINWIWTLGLALVGVLALAVSGIDKSTIVIGPLFVLASCLSLLRQTGRLEVDMEIPVLVIATGILLLVARYRRIPAPSWLLEPPNKPDGR
ncbi:MAG: hypothetical protein AB7G28_13010 [Pirellulales bacterium]